MDEGKENADTGTPRGKAKAPLTKAERRELQERQRAAKAAKTAPTSSADSGGADGGGGAGRSATQANPSSSSSSTGKPHASSQRQKDTPNESKTVQLFSHLAGFARGHDGAATASLAASDIHPSVVLLGQRYASGAVRGSNARAVAMLSAFKDVIRDYATPAGTALSRDLVKHLLPMIQFLIHCRPHSVSMGNSIKFVKNVVANVPHDMGEAEAKAKISEDIDAYIQERIVVSAASIAAAAVEKITEGDVILTYGSSSLVETILMTAKAEGGSGSGQGDRYFGSGGGGSGGGSGGGGGGSGGGGEAKQDARDARESYRRSGSISGACTYFRVIVVDSRPGLEGRRMAQRLSAAGIECTYLLLNGMSYIMREVTKVLLGASALMANGAALSRVGTALVAMMAKSHNIPTLFCCETYKFCERVQLDSIVHNELGNPSELSGSSGGDEAAEVPGLQFLNLRYDLTPIKYVSLVVTEAGFIPPTSVPVLMRELTRKEERGEGAN